MHLYAKPVNPKMPLAVNRALPLDKKVCDNKLTKTTNSAVSNEHQKTYIGKKSGNDTLNLKPSSTVPFASKDSKQTNRPVTETNRFVNKKEPIARKPSRLTCLPFEFFPNGNEELYRARYTELETIGQGSFGVVKLLRAKRPLERDGNLIPLLAVKIIDLVEISQVNGEGDVVRMKQEAAMIKSLDHINIIKIFEVYESDRYLWEVMELCSGGDLLRRPVKSASPNEPYWFFPSEGQVRQVCRSIFEALYYLHRKHIAHRDLKPENFLWSNEDKRTCELKLVDYGLANYMKGDPNADAYKLQTLRTRAGSPHYAAPEILMGAPAVPYSCKCDCWSAGVILHLLLTGCLPFDGPNDGSVLDSVMNDEIDWNHKNLFSRSAFCKDLLRKVLNRSPTKRLCAKQALEHPWLSESDPLVNLPDTSVNAQQVKDAVKSMCRFHSAPLIKKLALCFIARFTSTKYIKPSIDLFRRLDKQRKGNLTVEEIMSNMQQYLELINHTLPPRYFQEVLKSIDYDNTGRIELSKFTAATLKRNAALEPSAVAQAFDRIDREHTGKIGLQELKRFFVCSNIASSDALISQAIREVTNGKATYITKSEFQVMIKNIFSSEIIDSYVSSLRTKNESIIANLNPKNKLQEEGIFTIVSVLEDSLCSTATETLAMSPIRRNNVLSKNDENSFFHKGGTDINLQINENIIEQKSKNKRTADNSEHLLNNPRKKIQYLKTPLARIADGAPNNEKSSFKNCLPRTKPSTLVKNNAISRRRLSDWTRQTCKLSEDKTAGFFVENIANEKKPKTQLIDSIQYTDRTNRRSSAPSKANHTSSLETLNSRKFISPTSDSLNNNFVSTAN